MVRTRDEIYDKIQEIRNDPKLDLYTEMSKWLDTLQLPQTITVAGEQRDPKQMILDDLESYT